MRTRSVPPGPAPAMRLLGVAQADVPQASPPAVRGSPWPGSPDPCRKCPGITGRETRATAECAGGGRLRYYSQNTLARAARRLHAAPFMPEIPPAAHRSEAPWRAGLRAARANLI